jgi:hypothetical protein
MAKPGDSLSLSADDGDGKFPIVPGMTGNDDAIGFLSIPATTGFSVAADQC